VQHCNDAQSRDPAPLQVAYLISVNVSCVTAVLIIKNLSKSENVKARSRADKYR